MRSLNFQLKQMQDHNRDGSFTSQADRESILDMCADQLFENGFLHMRADSLREKHVLSLVERWKEEGIDVGTMKNRMSALRWWSKKIGKDNLIRRDNASYGIGNRKYVTNVSKAKVILAAQYAQVTDAYTFASFQLQETFGLRREESIKLQPRWADLGDKLRLKSSWTKGGKYREVPITTPEQRAALDASKSLAGSGSLIPKHMSYKDQLERFKAQCEKAGICNVHGLRHHYAQTRYKQLTGRECPALGGLTSKQLSAEQKRADRAARLAIAAELGHGREQITAQYLGR